MNASPPRVLVATNMYPSPSDPARGAFVQAQVEAIGALGIPVDVFQVRGERRARNYLAAIAPLRRRVRAFAADVVYAFYGTTGWVALWQPAPLVLSLAGDDVLGTPDGRGGLTLKSRVGVFLSQWAARRAAAVCVMSEEMRTRLWGSGLRRRTLVLPYGVDPQRFHPGDQAAARRRLGLPLEERLVIFPSTPTEPRKRLDLAQAAMTLVQRDVPNAVLRVVTRVAHRDMPDYYRAADCCLLTSDWEGSPNVVKEALLSGLPVVTTDVGDVRRWVPLSAESAIADATPPALAAAVTRVLRERRRVDPRPFLDAFSSPAIASRTVEILRAVSRSRDRGAR
jgi:glycosyltransferase involved in cell wall biosynthesis